MHVRHEALFNWIEQTFPGGKLYGPYNHDGRHYFQWMARGSYLREVLMPILDQYLTAQLDAASAERYEEMKARYHRRLGLAAQAILEEEGQVVVEEGEENVNAPVPELEEQGGRAQLGGERLTAADIFDRLRHEPPL
jgi:glutathione S-transferase